jgi:NAD(P)-dependent dehydrogenase (short-subunit alcohol dehydrogenase family)
VAVLADVADETSTPAMAAGAGVAFGSIDVLVNNAAVYAGLERRRFDEIEVAEWERVMAVKLRGPRLCPKACASALREAGGRNRQCRVGHGAQRLALVGALRRRAPVPVSRAQACDH